MFVQMSFPSIPEQNGEKHGQPVLEQIIRGPYGTNCYDVNPVISSCYALLLIAFPLSMFLIGVAIGQADILGFYFWVSIACFVGSLPWIVAISTQRMSENLRRANTFRPLQDLENQPFGVPTLTVPPDGVPSLPSSLTQYYSNQEDWLWQGWKVRYTVVHNPQSQMPVILLHGFGGSMGHWRQNIEELAKYHTVYAIDLLGFGASEKPVAPYGIGLWVEQVYEFWQTFVQVPTVLVGNSIGSVISLAAAGTHPEMARGVVMISLPDTSGSEESIPGAIRPLVRRLKSTLTSPLFLQPVFHLVRQPWIVDIGQV